LVDNRAERAEHGRRLMDPLQRNVRVDVAAPEKHRRAVERSRILTGRSCRPDQTSTQTDNSSEACRVACGILERETRPLRKTEQRDALRSNSLRPQIVDERHEYVQGRGQVGLVVGDRRQKGTRVPRMPECFRRNIRDIVGTELSSERDYVGGGSATPVDENDGQPCGASSRPAANNRLATVRIRTARRALVLI